MAPASDTEQALLHEALCSFLEAWPLKLAKCALRALEAAAFRSAGLINGDTLDIGCGDGTFGSFVAPADRIWGLDLDVERLKMAGRRGMRPVLGDAGAIPIADSTVDVVISNSTLEHMPDPRPAIREAGRVLRPGGRFIFTVPVATGEDNLFFVRAGHPEYAQLFATHWQHSLIIAEHGWADLVHQEVPQLRLARVAPIETPVQSARIDLLWSISVYQGALVDRYPHLLRSQREGLAELLIDLLDDDRETAVNARSSECLFEYVKDGVT